MYKIIFGIIVFITIFLFIAIIQEQRDWNKFAKEHHCYPVEYKKGNVNIGIGPVVGGNNGVGIIMIPESDETCYQCDDGKRYWR